MSKSIEHDDNIDIYMLINNSTQTKARPCLLHFLVCAYVFHYCIVFCCALLCYFMSVAWLHALDPRVHKPARESSSLNAFFHSVIHQDAWEFLRALLAWALHSYSTASLLGEMNQGLLECSVQPLELGKQLSWLQKTSVCISASSACTGMHVFSGVISSVIS